jgi:hypothetical protein
MYARAIINTRARARARVYIYTLTIFTGYRLQDCANPVMSREKAVTGLKI